MDLVLFFLFSTLEYIAIIMLLLTLFRMPIRDYLLPLIGICLVENAISFSLRTNENLANFAIVIQILTMVAMFKVFWRIQWFYSYIAVVIAYCGYLAIQVLMFLLMNYFGVFEMKQLQKEIVDGVTIIGYFLQFISALAAYLITIVIKKKNMGWQFIPDAVRKVRLTQPINMMLLVFCTASIICFGSMIFIGILGNELVLLGIFIFMLILLGSLIKISNQKDVAHD